MYTSCPWQCHLGGGDLVVNSTDAPRGIFSRKGDKQALTVRPWQKALEVCIHLYFYLISLGTWFFHSLDFPFGVMQFIPAPHGHMEF